MHLSHINLCIRYTLALDGSTYTHNVSLYIVYYIHTHIMSHVALGFVKIVLLISFHFPYFPCAFFPIFYAPSFQCVYTTYIGIQQLHHPYILLWNRVYDMVRRVKVLYIYRVPMEFLCRTKNMLHIHTYCMRAAICAGNQYICSESGIFLHNYRLHTNIYNLRI